MLLNLSNATRFIKLRDIIMLRAEGSYTEFYMKGGEKLLASKNLKLFEERLAGSSQFFRSHKSFIINLRCVRECNRSEGTVWLEGDYEAFLSGEKYDTLVSKMESLT
jgi:two-component system LytT family response regulator